MSRQDLFPVFNETIGQIQRLSKLMAGFLWAAFHLFKSHLRGYFTL